MITWNGRKTTYTYVKYISSLNEEHNTEEGKLKHKQGAAELAIISSYKSSPTRAWFDEKQLNFRSVLFAFQKSSSFDFNVGEILIFTLLYNLIVGRLKLL